MRALRVVLAALLVLLCAPAGALAHGDAATHYLESGSLYPGFGSQPSQAVEMRLIGLIDASARAGFPVKVALLGDESDVIDTPRMLRQPQRYAEFVATDLKRSRIPVSGPVLVVSPYGVGVAGPGAGRVDVATGTSGDQLATAAMASVRSLAEASGHALPANVPPAQVPVLEPAEVPGSGYDLSGLTPFLVFALVFGSAVAFYELRSRTIRRRPLEGA